MADMGLLDSLLDGNMDDDGNDFAFTHQHRLNVDKLPFPDDETINANILKICNDENMNKELDKLQNQAGGTSNTNQMTTFLLKLMVVTTMTINTAASHIDILQMVNQFEQKALNLKKATKALLHLKQETISFFPDEVLHLIGKNQTTNQYQQLSEAFKSVIDSKIKEISKV